MRDKLLHAVGSVVVAAFVVAVAKGMLESAPPIVSVLLLAPIVYRYLRKQS